MNAYKITVSGNKTIIGMRGQQIVNNIKLIITWICKITSPNQNTRLYKQPGAKQLKQTTNYNIKDMKTYKKK